MELEGSNEGSPVVGSRVGSVDAVGRYVGSFVLGVSDGVLEGATDGSVAVGCRVGEGFRSSRSPGTPFG